MQDVMTRLGLSHRPGIGDVPRIVSRLLGLPATAPARPTPKGLLTAPGLGAAPPREVKRSLLIALGLQPHPADRGKPLGLISGFGPRPVGIDLRTPRGLLVAPGLKPSPLHNAAPDGWLAAFGLHPRGVTPNRFRAALGLGPAVPAQRGLFIVPGPAPRGPGPALPRGILVRLGIVPASARFIGGRAPLVIRDLAPSRLTRPAWLAPPPAAVEAVRKLGERLPVADLRRKLNERVAAIDTSRPRQWLGTARDRLAALRNR
ncbi:hypothetical protein KTR66_11800 [Roseococcus sp. SDR]|uniref:hypothetical protein n=1 Tax=Roseococcus sp. SDR TaxID=2835532 RepID=UPI001BCC4FE1|nr:hypothetical protein [Roseococcus sp. SDR]MBS7790684.1 hypothetical protein [Roseococcus sp. SDR]MBV1845998.1 hypothetical protein [Roseococcus sp. SDR]